MRSRAAADGRRRDGEAAGGCGASGSGRIRANRGASARQLTIRTVGQPASRSCLGGNEGGEAHGAEAAQTHGIPLKWQHSCLKLVYKHTLGH